MRLDKEAVKQIALACGFTLKDGDDLKPYVYDFADAIEDNLAKYSLQEAIYSTLYQLSGDIPKQTEGVLMTQLRGLLDAQLSEVGQTPLAKRKIQSVIDSGEYREVKGATVLVSEDGSAAIVNSAGAFYWVDNDVMAREFDGPPNHSEVSLDMVGADIGVVAKTLEQHREEFEAWAKESTYLSLLKYRFSDDRYYADRSTDCAWAAWHAARGINS